MKNKKWIVMLTALSCSLLMMACGAQAVQTQADGTAQANTAENKVQTAAPGQSSAATQETLSGKLVASGSTSVQPLFEALAEAFMSKQSGVVIEVQAGGSSTGFKNVLGKVTEVGNLSRELKAEEAATPGLQQHVLAIDGIAVIVNKANPVQDLSLEQIAKLFTGTVTNWKELGGNDQPVVVVSREAGSGTRGAFEEIVKVTDKVKASQEVNETGIVKNTVAGNVNAVGYISLGSLDDSVHALKVDGVVADEAAVANGSYKITRPFIACNLGETSPVFKAFLAFAYSPDGQAIIKAEGLFPKSE